MVKPMDEELAAPSGKGRAGENFPVASFLIPRALRAPILTYYEFARTIDDIADSPKLGSDEKLRRLDRFAEALTGTARNPEIASRLRSILLAHKIPLAHALDLIEAFRRDATIKRYRDWQSLMEYCFLSAAPVGRFLIDLHGEDASCYPASDALCNALQVLNHLQDCALDYRTLDRVYLAETWMELEGATIGELNAPCASPALRRVLDLHLDHVRDLLRVALNLPASIRHRRFRAEAASIVIIARKLTGKLANEDPLAKHVALSRVGYAGSLFSGVLRAFRYAP